MVAASSAQAEKRTDFNAEAMRLDELWCGTGDDPETLPEYRNSADFRGETYANTVPARASRVGNEKPAPTGLLDRVGG
jgi:hypothetical protein